MKSIVLAKTILTYSILLPLLVMASNSAYAVQTKVENQAQLEPPVCPAEYVSAEVIIATTTNLDGKSRTINEYLEKMKTTFENDGRSVFIIEDHSDNTMNHNPNVKGGLDRQGYLDLMSCQQLLFFGVIEHANRYGLLLANGEQLTSDDISGAFGKGSSGAVLSSRAVFYFNTCNVFHGPFLEAMKETSAGTFVSSPVLIHREESEALMHCAIEKLLNGDETETAVNACEDRPEYVYVADGKQPLKRASPTDYDMQVYHGGAIDDAAISLPTFYNAPDFKENSGLFDTDYVPLSMDKGDHYMMMTGSDEQVSSIRIPENYLVEIFKDGFDAQTRLLLKPGDYNLGNLVDRHNGEDYNNALSSVRISRDLPVFLGTNYNNPNGAVILDFGYYTLNDLKSRGISNDSITEVHVPTNYVVILHKNHNFTGGFEIFETGVHRVSP